MIKIDNVIKTFSSVEVIKNCNMKVSSGSIYGLLGVNGSGKTTLFKLIMGLLTPTNGEIKIFDVDISTNRDEILKNIGSIIEVPVFYEHLSAYENLNIHLAYMNKDNSSIKETLELVGLKASNSQPVSNFSLGMRQRLSFARALIHNPKLLILDEPINGLDPMGIREIRELLIKLKKQGVTILISSHILSEIEHIADIIGVIVNGNIIKEVSLSKVKKEFHNGLEDYFFNIMKGVSDNV